MFDISLLIDNLLSPPVMCFGLGVIASLGRSDLRFPEALTWALSVYLLLAIGIKGGSSLRGGGEGLLPAMLATLAFGGLVPLAVYFVAVRLGRWAKGEAASLAAHYGSTSAVTFLAAIAFLEQLQMPVEGYLPALMAVMEVPAIVVGLLLANRSGASASAADRGLHAVIVHVLTGKTVLLLLGGMAIGLLSRPAGLEAVLPFFREPFAGVLAVFLLELGILAGDSLPALRRRLKFILPFGILAPLVFGGSGVAVGIGIGLSPGGATCFGVLCGSASYIAAPAAMRMACPDIDHALPLSASLGVTFPFNLAIGIPLLAAWAQMLSG